DKRSHVKEVEKRSLGASTDANTGNSLFQPMPRPLIDQLRMDHTYSSQAITVSGKVTDVDGEVLPGVNVIIKGSTQGTVTDVNGDYKISVPSQESVLVFSFVGYISEEITVGNQTEINATLMPDITSLEEIVVVGYGTQKKENLTGAVSTIDISNKLNQPLTNVSNALYGTPGMFVNLYNSMPGVDRARIRIRGVGTMNNNDPLVLVNGIEYSMDELNPEDIETITVLKDASAAIYGSR